MSKTKIGWIGLGLMGTPMSERLINAGFPLTVYNRNKEKEEALKAKGAKTAATPSLLIEQSDVVIIMVTNDAAIRSIFSGEEGLLSAETAGKIIINMSTVSPAISKEMNLLCKNQGHYYLDAPVSGSTKPAEDGQLVIMVGGDEAVFDQVKEILSHLGKMTLFLGDTGSGNAAKLAVNTLLGFYMQGLAEAIVLAQKNHIKTEDLLAVINNSALGNPFTKLKGEAILNDNYAPAFSLKNILKDLNLAKDAGLDTPLGKTVLETFSLAENDFGDEDLSAVFKQINR